MPLLSMLFKLSPRKLHLRFYQLMTAVPAKAKMLFAIHISRKIRSKQILEVVDKLPYRPIVNLLFAAPCEIRFAPFALVAGSRQLQASL